MVGGILAIFDDVAALLDDVSVMSKLAAKKTAGLLGDDLAVNAEQATGFHASRELPVIWAITKGSLFNKVIILPVAIFLSAFMPGLIVPILLLGGCYLSYEGAAKIMQWVGGKNKQPVKASMVTNKADLLLQEKKKIKSAIRTDFILSIEIIVVTLGTVMEHNLLVQVVVVSLIALLATAGVYGLVALIVRMDDIGYALLCRSREIQGIGKSLMQAVGNLLVHALPYVIRLLEWIGTLAMLLVGGGMFVHNIELLHTLFAAFPVLTGEILMGLLVGLGLFFSGKIIFLLKL